MARVAFPDRVDNFNFTQTREERNVYETTEKLSLLDLLYMIHELEKAYFTLSGGTISSSVTVSTDTSAASIASLSAEITSLSTQVAALPTHTEFAGVPSDSTGVNGSTHRDTRSVAEGGQMNYQRISGTWRQV